MRQQQHVGMQLVVCSVRNRCGPHTAATTPTAAAPLACPSAPQADWFLKQRQRRAAVVVAFVPRWG